MGCATSKQEPYTANAGTEAEYKERFTDSKTLGQGEFGVVKLVTDKSTNIQLASKILNKGFTFKDNELYPPMDAAELKMEIDILKVLNGQAYNLLLESIYESPSKVYVVTEICSGGEMLEYAGNNFKEGLRTEDVSRMAFQLLSAVDHCDRYNILHRDIKPENISEFDEVVHGIMSSICSFIILLFKSNSKDAELRLIDFGCATMDTTKNMTHQTFSGTPFYISPECFQKEYTTKTDVFSVGVVLYVLVAGYPAEQLQAAFNLLHKSKRDLKSLPGMPTDMPETYFDMLDKLLTYRYKVRKSAGDMLEEDDFVLFHQEHGDDVATTTTKMMTKAKSRTSRRASMKRTASIVLSGTGEKAALAFGFTKFARALTTILATMLNHGDIKALLANVDEHLKKDDSLDTKLGVIKVDDLIKILESMGKKDCIAAIDKQKDVDTYKSYNYEYTLLKAFDNKAATDARNAGTGVESSSLKKSSAMGLSARKLTVTGGSSMRKLNMKKSRQAQSVYIRGI
ncbi:serine/threonine-protein kinase [Skeletonema marinoi]|uniref:Serine/threonine-protein kinase n=1 Tax=Skeletonema marinoi TaxID=267567 RepID=A0AAD9D506_9STRA|nr:serine/threonine-protein kinase [Skeletonema marinoi]